MQRIASCGELKHAFTLRLFVITQRVKMLFGAEFNALAGVLILTEMPQLQGQ